MRFYQIIDTKSILMYIVTEKVIPEAGFAYFWIKYEDVRDKELDPASDKFFGKIGLLDDLRAKTKLQRYIDLKKKPPAYIESGQELSGDKVYDRVIIDKGEITPEDVKIIEKYTDRRILDFTDEF